MAAFVEKAEKINASRNDRSVSPHIVSDRFCFEGLSCKSFRFEFADATLNTYVGSCKLSA